MTAAHDRTQDGEILEGDRPAKRPKVDGHCVMSGIAEDDYIDDDEEAWNEIYGMTKAQEDETMGNGNDKVDGEINDTSGEPYSADAKEPSLVAAAAKESPTISRVEGSDIEEHDKTGIAPGLGASVPGIKISKDKTQTVAAKSDILRVADHVKPVAAETAQKEQPDAEWEFDSSAAESSSSDESSGSSYEMLDPLTAAKMLMENEGDELHQFSLHDGPRTAHENIEEPVKPDIIITEDMKITALGTVQSIIENLILIKGTVSGEYQVLESGSVLCNEHRKPVGVVAETLGRVQEPMYSVVFNNKKEIEDAALISGTTVYYVDQHSTFVFTQPLHNQKGTDASNKYNEEADADEMEFSDDEAETRFRRMQKLARKAAKGEGQEGSPSTSKGRPFVSQKKSEANLPQDDDEPDEFYRPLKRPDNLSELMAAGSSKPDRGRGRGRWGNRGRNHGGGAGQAGRQHQRPAQSFPDRHNKVWRGGQQQRPSSQRVESAWNQPAAASTAPAHQPAPTSFLAQQLHALPQGSAHTTNDFPHPFNQPLPAQPPPGAYINPGFFQNQQYTPQLWSQLQYQQLAAAQQQQVYGGWTALPQQAQATWSAQPPEQPNNDANQQQQPPDLAEILRRINGEAR
ncbi:NAF1-domain-containing protein [Piedraia hortae CBS 480.64]|uniref:H/ACA ribonucleoprotein complex non-core subunit NAF1 n=1 Tax=Piedraia hortae CBS 480.64 TaxID=1314780 RepID=A0A6A7C664_9PEZI|nr:NAF1-domain-containing protein [Piedraia hortae CBS 480.64]